MLSREVIDPHISSTRVRSSQPTFACFMLRGLPSVSHGAAKGFQNTARERRADHQGSRKRARTPECVAWNSRAAWCPFSMEGSAVVVGGQESRWNGESVQCVP